MSIFTQVEQTVSDYNVLWAAFRESAQQAADITKATAARIAANRRQADERTATLTTQSRDPARPEVVRKLASQELERLQKRTFAPAEDEVATFNSAIEDAQAALRDVRKVNGQLQDLFTEANKALSTLRARTLGNQSRDVDMSERHLAGEQRAFDLLGKTGRPGGQS